MWGKVDDRFHGHSKARRAGIALALWTLALSWSCAELTDGHVPDDMPDLLIPGGSEMAATLVRVGLWERTESGYQFHDWAEYQISAKEVRKGRDAVSVARSKAGRKGAEVKWQKPNVSANSHEKSDGKRHGKTMANRWQTDGPIPIPIPIPREDLSLPNPPLASESEGTQNALRPREIETPRCSTVEHTQQIDTQAIKYALASKIPALSMLPGDCEYKLASAIRGLVAQGEISTKTWEITAEWLAAGGVRMAPKGRPSWQWLVGHGGGPLAKCLSTAIEWDAKGRPPLDGHGIPTTPKSAPAASKAPVNVPVVSSSLAYLRDGKRMTPEEFAASSALHKARIAAKNAAERAAAETEVTRVSA